MLSTQVWARDGGGLRLLDPGDVDSGLLLNGRTVSWTHSGVTRSATLEPIPPS